MNNVKTVLDNTRQFLCNLDTDQQVFEAIEKIVKHENQSDLVDYIDDDIIVWEKVQDEFTCEEFLEEIGYYPEFEEDYSDEIPDDTDPKQQQIVDAKQLLKDAGFFTGNLWTVTDVKDKLEGGDKLTDEQAQDILDSSLTNEATMEQIWFSISEFGRLNYNLETKD